MPSHNAVSTRFAPTLAPSRVGHHRTAIGITLVLVAQLMLILDATVVQVASPKIRATLGFHPTTLLRIVNGYALPYGGLLLMGGRLGDVFGRLRTFRLGLAIFTTASLIAGLAPTAVVLLGPLVVARLRPPSDRFWVGLDLAGGSIDGHGVEYLGFEERCEARRAEPPADAHAAREHQVAEAGFRRDVCRRTGCNRSRPGRRCPSA
jgi:hypothetical protein